MWINSSEIFQSLRILSLQKKKKTKRKQVETSEEKDPSDGDDNDNDDAPPPQKKAKKVRIAPQVVLVEPTQEPARTAPFTRITRSAARGSSKFVVLSNDDFNMLYATLDEANPEPTPVHQQTAHPSPPRASFFQPSIEEEPLWKMLQANKPSASTSPIILPYNPQPSEPIISETQAQEIPNPEKANSEPQPSHHSNEEHSEREDLSPCPTISNRTNVLFSSPSNKSEASHQFFQLVRERTSEIPELFLSVPSPNRSSGPRPEPLVAPDSPIQAVPLASMPPPPPPPHSPFPENVESVSNHSLDTSPNIETEVPQPNPETNISAHQTLQIGSPSEVVSSNHSSSPKPNLSLVPYTYSGPITFLECINAFNHEASLRISNVHGRTDLSASLDLVAED